MSQSNETLEAILRGRQHLEWPSSDVQSARHDVAAARMDVSRLLAEQYAETDPASEAFLRAVMARTEPVSVTRSAFAHFAEVLRQFFEHSPRWKVESAPRRTMRLESAMSVVDEYIEDAATKDAAEAAEELERILSALDSAQTHAEARLRRLIRKLPTLPLADAPAWLTESLHELRAERSRGVIDSVAKLFRVLLGGQGGYSAVDTPRISGGPNESVSVEWSDQLCWLVYPSRIAWPFVNVRVYAPEGETLVGRTFYYSKSVISYSLKFL